MSIEFRTVTIDQPPRTGPPGTVRGTTDEFSNTILSAEACIKSWELRFVDDDHEYYQSLVTITGVNIEGRRVQVEMTMGIRDSSGEWDDRYEGQATVLVIAEVSRT